MMGGYHGEREIILNVNDSWAMSSSRFMVNKKRQKLITSSKFSIFQNVFIENVTINNYEVVELFLDNSVLSIYLLNSSFNSHIDF
jgi:hypothetical protein